MTTVRMELPESMSAVLVEKPGGPEAMKVVALRVPTPAAGEVLVAVEAAGVNRPDLLQREGRYPPPPGISPVLGLEMAGRVAACGEGVESAWMGRSVCALVAGGAYAEYCVAPVAQCLPVPAGLSTLEAAALPEACFTVWTNLIDDGGLRAGECVLIHGGGSGIGTTAIQLARAIGARVVTTAGSDERCARCQQLGAELAINYRRDDFVQSLSAHTNGRGVDVVLDMVGGDYTQRNLDALAPRGRLVQIAVQGGSKVTLNLLTIMQKRLTVTGSTLRVRSVAEKGRIREAVEQVVWPLVSAGRLGPVVDAVFELSRVADAHQRLERGEVFGKVVLRVGRGA